MGNKQRRWGTNNEDVDQTAGTLFEVCNFEVWTLEHDKAFEVIIPITIGIKQRRCGSNDQRTNDTSLFDPDNNRDCNFEVWTLEHDKVFGIKL